MSHISPKFIFLSLVLISLAGLSAHTVAAAGKSGNYKPGWGHGDKNHHHEGPPGLSVRPSVRPSREAHEDEQEDTRESKHENAKGNGHENKVERED